MTPKLVYLHIPKSAGSSHRRYLEGIFGGETTLWYDIDSSAAHYDSSEVGDCFSIGGHRPVSFYPCDLDALYTAVVREPVARAASYYAFLVNPPPTTYPAHQSKQARVREVWQDRGLDFDSLTKSIEQCDSFRAHINNYQCGYLSRYANTLDGVRRTISEGNFVLGDFDSLGVFNNFFFETLQFPPLVLNSANVSSGRRSGGVLSDRGAVELIRELNAEDQRLYDYVHFECAGLYCEANNLRDVSRLGRELTASRSAAELSPVDLKRVQLFTKGIQACQAEKVLRIALAVANSGGHPLVFSHTDDRTCAVGWRVVAAGGKPVPQLCGIARSEAVVLPKSSQVLEIQFELPHHALHESDAELIEFCIVREGRWLWDDYPLNSGFSSLIRT